MTLTILRREPRFTPRLNSQLRYHDSHVFHSVQLAFN